MNKNLVIGILAGLLLLSAFWGQNEAGKNKALIREQEAQQQAETTAAVNNQDKLEGEIAQQKEAQQKITKDLETATGEVATLSQENEELKGTLAELKGELAEKDTSVGALEKEIKEAVHNASKMKNALVEETQQQIIAQQKQIRELQQQVEEQQAIIEQDKEKLTSASKVIEQEQKEIKKYEEAQVHLEVARAELQAVKANMSQLEEEQASVVLESETMRAQVIGLERIVEERSANLEVTGKELQSCKINNTVLISKIAEQGDALQGLQEQKITLAEEFAARQQKAEEQIEELVQ
ncbi:MAG: hypothetical protein D3923_04840 [Candidatus Electrothrix sp. AR3]|nr:hypothetical protein [Candidatus Electrothrix sp. AR3]